MGAYGPEDPGIRFINQLPPVVWWGGFTVLCVIVLALVLLTFLIYHRAKIRERIVTAALQNNQLDFAVYTLNSPKRFLAWLFLIASFVVMTAALNDREGAIALVAGFAAVLSVFFIFRWSRFPRSGRQDALPPASSPEPARYCPMQAQPDQNAPQAPRQAAFSSAGQGGGSSESFLEKALAIASATLLVFAGVVITAAVPTMAFAVAIVALAYFVMKPARRARVLKAVGGAMGRAAAWFSARGDRVQRTVPPAVETAPRAAETAPPETAPETPAAAPEPPCRPSESASASGSRTEFTIEP